MLKFVLSNFIFWPISMSWEYWCLISVDVGLGFTREIISSNLGDLNDLAMWPKKFLLLSKSKSYQLVDFNINYKTKNFTVKGSINNLLDKKYYTNLIKSWDNKAYVYPQPGRTLFLGLEAKF